MSDLRTYIDSTGELPEDCILGWLVVWSVVDFEPGITPEYAKDLFAELQLNPAFIPPPPKKIDAFRKATSGVKHEHTQPDGKIISYLTRDVTSTSSFVERHVIREVRDSTRRVLEHAKAMEAVFYKQHAKDATRRVAEGTERFRLTAAPKGYPTSEQKYIDDMTAEIEQRYDTFSTHLDAQRIRTVLRDYVRSMDSVLVKGSLYFVDKAHTGELRRLAEFMGKLPGACRMSMIPLVDVADARHMIVDAFQTEARESMNRLIEKCAELQKTRTRITPDAYAAVRAEYDQIETRAYAYRERMQVNALIDEATAEAAIEAVAGLGERMLDDNSEVTK